MIASASVELAPVAAQVLEQVHQPRREHVTALRQNRGQRLPQPGGALAHGDPVLEQEAADLVDHRRALADQPAAHAVQSLQLELLAALERDEAHGRPLHGLGDRFGIAIVVLVALQERLHVLRRDQADLMAEGGEAPADMVRAGASLQADQAGRQIGQALLEPAARQLLAP